ncbi:hypothetical protein HMPREF9135_1715 [Segatella baroniae F0067]|uniref:Uncharacterized protein n=1 Tax=Segatella baroniae F0067 TaxID=1115809 RepID=U2P6H4_9BACT|nr:hypothetical protein HMPREF9135_1715 [Segatella baroniae F0067]
MAACHPNSPMENHAADHSPQLPSKAKNTPKAAQRPNANSKWQKEKSVEEFNIFNLNSL